MKQSLSEAERQIILSEEAVDMEGRDDPSQVIVITGIPAQIHGTNQCNDKTEENSFVNHSEALS